MVDLSPMGIVDAVFSFSKSEHGFILTALSANTKIDGAFCESRLCTPGQDVLLKVAGVEMVLEIPDGMNPLTRAVA